VSDRFDELVDHPSLTTEERARLRRVHDLLLEVGPPPEAPPHLSPPPGEAQVIPLRRRSRGVALLAAALGAAAVGGAGYLLGDRSGAEEAAQTVTVARTATQATTVIETVTTAPEQPSGPVVRMAGVGAASGASATVELLPRAESGDYPVRIRAEGLPERTTFEMWLVDDDGEFDKLCGSFTSGYGETDETITVPYEMRTRDDWVIVRPGTTEPVLTTT
jgi:hypothetical protein